MLRNTETAETRTPTAAFVVAAVDLDHPSSSRLAYQMCASPSYAQDQTAVDLVDRGQIPSPSAVLGFTGDEPWTKSGRFDSA